MVHDPLTVGILQQRAPARRIHHAPARNLSQQSLSVFEEELIFVIGCKRPIVQHHPAVPRTSEVTHRHAENLLDHLLHFPARSHAQHGNVFAFGLLGIAERRLACLQIEGLPAKPGIGILEPLQLAGQILDLAWSARMRQVHQVDEFRRPGPLDDLVASAHHITAVH